MSTYWVKNPGTPVRSNLIGETDIGDFNYHRVVLFLIQNKPHDVFFNGVLMEVLMNSFLLVFASEMGDKTQLLALLLATRYKKPWTILLGVFIATILNHALASWAGSFVSSLVSAEALRWILAAIFFVFGLWILIPDKEEEFKEVGHFGALMTTIIVFFLAEMGDKTQLATVALGARYQDTLTVTVGTTLGMMGSNALAIFLGKSLLKRIPMKWVRIFACFLFIVFGIVILIGVN